MIHRVTRAGYATCRPCLSSSLSESKRLLGLGSGWKGSSGSMCILRMPVGGPPLHKAGTVGRHRALHGRESPALHWIPRRVVPEGHHEDRRLRRPWTLLRRGRERVSGSEPAVAHSRSPRCTEGPDGGHEGDGKSWLSPVLSPGRPQSRACASAKRAGGVTLPLRMVPFKNNPAPPQSDETGTSRAVPTP